ncbi:hypothetical protein V501_02372 [Pseudogymnoascus sp. VKM F-4519 (FW-2642)]|nr:hypothetical protein V501_02372 [Pseudogymnoascus sp. VKM F-4519 (FW-2642)]
MDAMIDTYRHPLQTAGAVNHRFPVPFQNLQAAYFILTLMKRAGAGLPRKFPIESPDLHTLAIWRAGTRAESEDESEDESGDESGDLENVESGEYSGTLWSSNRASA